jgi:hypothetical protein
LALAVCMTGCLGDGGAVNVRWRVEERETGRLDDPRDISDGNGVCCQTRVDGQPCGPASGWIIPRVRLRLEDPTTDGVVNPDLPGLTAECGARELTTPFDLPSGTYAITLVAYNPADPDASCAEAQSPLPEIRSVKKADIVQLDVVELSVSATQGELCPGGG